MKMNPLWMIFGCALPMLLIPVVTHFGVNGYAALGIAMVLMAACHLFMPGHHQDETPRGVSPDAPRKENTHTDESKS